MTNKRFMLTIPADDYEAIRAAAFTHGTQPAVEARNLLLTQLRIAAAGDTDQGTDIPGTTYRRMAQEAERLAAQARYITARMQAEYPTTTEENR